MNLPLNMKMTFNNVTYRGGDEIPEEVAVKIGLHHPTTKTQVVENESIGKEGNNGDESTT